LFGTEKTKKEELLEREKKGNRSLSKPGARNFVFKSLVIKNLSCIFLYLI